MFHQSLRALGVLLLASLLGCINLTERSAQPERPPSRGLAYLAKHGRPWDAPRAHCDKARSELGLETHAIEDTLQETGRSLIELGLIEPALK